MTATTATSTTQAGHVSQEYFSHDAGSPEVPTFTSTGSRISPTIVVNTTVMDERRTSAPIQRC